MGGVLLALVAAYGVMRWIRAVAPAVSQEPTPGPLDWSIGEGTGSAGGVDLIVDDIECICDDKGVVSVTGVLTNVSDTPLRHAEVEVDFFDESGERIGNALALTNRMAQGATWRFKVLCPGNDATRYEIVRVAAS